MKGHLTGWRRAAVLATAAAALVGVAVRSHDAGIEISAGNRGGQPEASAPAPSSPSVTVTPADPTPPSSTVSSSSSTSLTSISRPTTTTTAVTSAGQAVTVAVADLPGLYLIGRDGTGLRRLSNAQGNGPAWSPDGRWIAFVEGTDVHVLDPLTGADRKVADGFANQAEQVSWSPDSKRLAYPGHGTGISPGERDIWIADVDGTNPARPIRWPADDSGVAWGPGDQLGSLGSDGIWNFKADGSSRARVAEDPVGWGVLGWSLDGKWLSASSPGSNYNHVLHANGGEARSLGLAAHVPTWSPDGERMAFTGRDGYQPGLLVGPSSGGSARMISPWLHRPVWSPAGDLIAAVDKPDENNDRDVIVLDPDGAEQRLLTRLPPNLRFDDVLAWSPDGRTLAFTAYPSAVFPPRPRPVFGQGVDCGQPYGDDGNGAQATAIGDDYDILMTVRCHTENGSNGAPGLVARQLNAYFTAARIDYGDGTSVDITPFPSRCSGSSPVGPVYISNGGFHVYPALGEYTITYTATLISCHDARRGQEQRITLSLRNFVVNGGS